MRTSLLAVALFGIICLSAANEWSRGFGENVNWVSFEEGKKISKETGKPQLLLIHKTWCGACKRLKGSFSDDSAVVALQDHFVMSNVEDDEEPQEDEFRPSGSGYIPRILFLENGVVRDDVFNANGNPSYKYFYPNVEAVAEGMKHALLMLKKPEEL